MEERLSHKKINIKNAGVDKCQTPAFLIVNNLAVGN